MKITKLAHSCLLVEMPSPTNRTVLFDPGSFSVELVKAANLEFLDDIVITHEHFDHFDEELVINLAQRFPAVRVLAPQVVVDRLQTVGVAANTVAPEGLEIFEAPHEALEPLGETPQAIGVHYLDMLSHPGDSHHFSSSKAILALPITAPWGSTVNAVRLATELKPKVIIPIHDHIWSDEWRQRTYKGLTEYFERQGIEFVQPVNGQALVLNLEMAQAS
jgi:L-ascorbate metabolism protein UlaG (beta-lactamase superfamily)